MKKQLFRFAAVLAALSLALAACSSGNLPTLPSISSGEPTEITGTFTYTNDIITTYYVEQEVALVDMYGFVTRNKDWKIPVASQTLGFLSIDPTTKTGKYAVQLPAKPTGEMMDVANNGGKDQGVQVFAVSYWPNLTGGPYSEGDDPSKGWPTYLASVVTDSENQDEVVSGNLVIWAPDANQKFPTGFGTDKKLFTADDPVGPIPAGYSIVNLDKEPFTVTQTPEPSLTLYEPKEAAIKDFSKESYTQAFSDMFNLVRKDYAFDGIQGKEPNWDQLYAALQPRVADAEQKKDANAYYIALRDFTWAFKDGHVGLDGGDFANKDFTNATSGGFGFALRQLDDGRVIVLYVMDGGPAAQAGMKVGAEVTEFNGQPIKDAIAAVHPYVLQSSDYAISYQKLRYLLAVKVGTQAKVTFTNPGGAFVGGNFRPQTLKNMNHPSQSVCLSLNLPVLCTFAEIISASTTTGSQSQTVTLKAIAERNSFSRTSLYYGASTDPLLPVDYQIMDEGTSQIGYIIINSNYDDLNLIIRLFQRAMQQFQDRKVAGIIIDLRYNSGGSPLGLAGFLYNKDIVMGQLEYYSNESQKFVPEGEPEKITPNVEQYHIDKMAVLLSPACYSACELEAYGFSQVPGMMVIGQYPTAGVEAEVSRGQFLLPEGMSLQIPFGRFVLPDGRLFLEGQGVKPTIKVPIDEKTALSTDDVVLNAAVDAVLGKASAGGPAPSVPLPAAAAAPKIASKDEALSALSSGVLFLEDKAQEKYSDTPKPGTYPFTVSLSSSDQVIWGYIWCATTTDILATDLKSIQLKFTLDGKDVPESDFGASDQASGGQQCRIVYTALSAWPVGAHRITTTATFTSKINDGTSDYAAGDYVLDYTVNVQ